MGFWAPNQNLCFIWLQSRSITSVSWRHAFRHSRLSSSSVLADMWMMSLERHKKHMRKSPTQDSTMIPHKKLRAPKLNPALRHWECSSSESGGVTLIVQTDIHLMGGRYRGAGVEAYTHGLERKHKHTQGLQSVPVWFQSPFYLCLFSFRSVSHPLWQPLLSPGGYTVLSSCSTIWFCSAPSYPNSTKESVCVFVMIGMHLLSAW